MSKEGRGRISSIDSLPDEAGEAIDWAAQQLLERKRTAKDILAEFNGMLAELDIGPISASAFGRHSLGMARIGKRIETVKAITQTMSERLEPGQTDDLTIMVAETIKTLVFELLNKHGEAGLTPKAAMEMASALKSAVSAQKVSADRRRAIEAEMKTKINTALDKVGKQNGISGEMIVQIKSDLF